jgi:hypothetical protein
MISTTLDYDRGPEGVKKRRECLKIAEHTYQNNLQWSTTALHFVKFLFYKYKTA